MGACRGGGRAAHGVRGEPTGNGEGGTHRSSDVADLLDAVHDHRG